MGMAIRFCPKVFAKAMASWCIPIQGDLSARVSGMIGTLSCPHQSNT